MTRDLSTRPHFLIIGAQKSGTTSLAAMLGADDRVFVPRQKELHFLSRDSESLSVAKIEEYIRAFAPARTDQMVGEATPNYLMSRFAAEKAFEVSPCARIIVILRDPIERAVSAYMHARRLRVIPAKMTFEQCLERDSRNKGSRWTGTVSDGFYAIGLRRWLSVFPSEQVQVSYLEDFATQEETEIRRIYRHLGLAEPERDLVFPHVNEARHLRFPLIVRLTSKYLTSKSRIRRLVDIPSRRPIDRPVLSQPTLAFLRKTYSPHLEHLEQLVDRDLSHWPSHPRYSHQETQYV